MEYEKSFLSNRIDFVSFLGVRCPICGGEGCYRPMTPYWRYAIELFPEFKKERIPIARFLCRKWRKTFSLLPIQLIPYFQYTVGAGDGDAAVWTGMLAEGTERVLWRLGGSGRSGPGRLLTPWLITCWLRAVIRGLRRGHGALRQFYNLDAACTSGAWEEAAAYFDVFGLRSKTERFSRLMDPVYRYSRATGQFLFGTPSQYRSSS